jgi:hypothetical protein
MSVRHGYQYRLGRRVESVLCGLMFWLGLVSLLALLYLFGGCAAPTWNQARSAIVWRAR